MRVNLRLLAALCVAATLAVPAPTTLAADPGATPTGRSAAASVTGPGWTDGILGGHDAAAAEADVTFTVVGVESAFAPESYKLDDRFNTRNPDDLENQTTNWDTALGHRISFLVRVEPGDQPLGCDDRFVAETFIDTLDGRLYGWTNGSFATAAPGGVEDLCTTGLPGVRVFNLTFDLDGAPAPVSGAVDGTRYPALANGFYTATLNLYHQISPSPTNPAGQGPLAGSYLIGFAVANPQFSIADGFLRFPESALRMWTDVGAGDGLSTDQFLMPPTALTSGGETNVTITFPGAPVNATFDRVDWYATRAGSGVDVPVQEPVPGINTPLDELGDKLGGQADRFPLVMVGRQEYNLDNDTVPASRAVLMPVGGANFQSQTTADGTDYIPLHVVSIVIPATLDTYVTGASSYVQPVSNRNFDVRSIEVFNLVGPLEQTGMTRVTLYDAASESGGPTGTDAGDLFAFVAGADQPIAESTLTREPGAKWVTGDIDHVTFPAQVGAYTMLALLYGPGDAFLGVERAARGIDLQITAPQLVEGRAGQITLRVTNLMNDFDATPGEADLAMDILVEGSGIPGQGDGYNQTVTDLPEGASRQITIDVNPSEPGSPTVTFTATSGELTVTREIALDVISRAKANDRKWYDIPGPALPVTIVALLALALLRRRE